MRTTNKWEIVVGKRVYRDNLTRKHAQGIYERLHGTVLGLKMRTMRYKGGEIA